MKKRELKEEGMKEFSKMLSGQAWNAKSNYFSIQYLGAKFMTKLNYSTTETNYGMSNGKWPLINYI